VDATIDGEPLDERQLHGYLSLLIGAGETTPARSPAGELLEHPASATGYGRPRRR
jgi:hypothetical protein